MVNEVVVTPFINHSQFTHSTINYFLRSSPDKVGQSAAAPDRRQPHNDMHRHVEQGQLIFPILQKVVRLIAKGGKGRKTTQHPGKQQQARLRCEHAPRLGQLGQQPNHQAADQVDGQRAIRKGRTTRPILHQPAYPIAQAGPDKSTESDEENVWHRKRDA